MTGAFLCAEHALTEVESIFLNVCLALTFTKDQNLRWNRVYKLRNSRIFFALKLFQDMPQKKKPKVLTSISLSVSEVNSVSVRPQPRPRTQLSRVSTWMWFSPATIPSDPAKLWPREGRQTGGKANRSTCSPAKRCIFGFLVHNYTLTGFHNSNVVVLSGEVEVFVKNYLGYVELPGERNHQYND